MVEPATPAVTSIDEGKLHPPHARVEWIERPRLVERLARAAQHPVVLIAAPAGYGKSTLVTQWFDSDSAPDLKAWVRLDSGDNDPTRLWTHLTAALERTGCLVDENVADFIAASATATLDRVVPRVIESLAASRPTTLVLDDCHVVRAPACCEQLDYLISHLPSHVHLVLIARSDPALRLGRLRVAGGLAEIRTRELSFSQKEIEAVLQTGGVQLSPAAIGELARRTEGWPAAVYLAALSLGDRDDAEEFVHDLSGSNRFIADYLSEEVLNRQDGEVRSFILDMSVFDRFSASLGNSVTQTSASARLIRELERTNLFVISLDAGGVWFRFHHLFGTFARSALETESPERVAVLHTRATQWFADHGLIDEAVHHALAAGAGDRAADLIQANWVRYFDAGRATTVLGWLHELQGSPSEQGVAATVTAAWMAALTGQRAELNHRLAVLEAMPADTPGHSDAQLPDGTASAESALVLIRGLFGYDGPDQMLLGARRAVQLETDATTPWYAVAHAALGHAAYVVGDLSRARTELAGAAHAPAAPAAIRVLALGLMSLCEAELGHVRSAEVLAGMAMDVVTQHAMQAMPQGVLAFTALGAAMAASARTEEALSVLEDGLRTRRQVPGLSPWPLLHHLIVTATVAARSNRISKAQRLLAEIDELTPWTGETMAAMRARIQQAQGIVAQHHRRPEPPMIGEPLTPREREVLRRLQGERSLREIAADLYVSRNTIKTLTAALYRKLGAHSRSEALAIAREHTLI